MITRSKHGIFKPKALLSNCIIYSPLTKPRSISEAFFIKEWRVAMDLEFKALCVNNSWSLLPPHLNRQLEGCKWIFKVKQNFDGSVNKYKAHLVAKRFSCSGLILLAQAHILLNLLDHAFLTTIHLINCLPTPLLNHQSQFEAFFSP